MKLSPDFHRLKNKTLGRIVFLGLALLAAGLVLMIAGIKTGLLPFVVGGYLAYFAGKAA
jgi:hypothetical protein